MKRKIKLVWQDVRVFENVFNRDTNKVERLFMYNAKFRQFGVDFEEVGNTAGMFTTAVVEQADGTIKNVPVQNIQFMRI